MVPLLAYSILSFLCLMLHVEVSPRVTIFLCHIPLRTTFMRFKFTIFINQNGLDKFVEHNVCKQKGKNENFIRLGHSRYKNGTTKSLLPKETVTESPSRIKSIARFGDLGEDDDERAHQEEARNESRVGAVLNLAKNIVPNHSLKQ